jgi:RNA polymerase sigma factor (sigma-70 family)
MLTDEQLCKLAKKHAEAGEVLYRRYRGLIYCSAQQFLGFGTVFNREELLSHLNEAFWRAILNFRPKQGVKFKTYFYNAVFKYRHAEDYLRWNNSVIHTPRDNDPKICLSTDYVYNNDNEGVSEFWVLLKGVSEDFSPHQRLKMDVEAAIEKVMGQGRMKPERKAKVIYLLMQGNGPYEMAKALGIDGARGTQLKNQIYEELRRELWFYE